MKILLAEDDFASRKFMSKILDKYGEADITVNGLEAVDAFLMALDDDERYDLVILDEFGYISSDKEGAELLFTNLSIRTGRKSTIITTNLSFGKSNSFTILITSSLS